MEVRVVSSPVTLPAGEHKRVSTGKMHLSSVQVTVHAYVCVDMKRITTVVLDQLEC